MKMVIFVIYCIIKPRKMKNDVTDFRRMQKEVCGSFLTLRGIQFALFCMVLTMMYHHTWIPFVMCLVAWKVMYLGTILYCQKHHSLLKVVIATQSRPRVVVLVFKWMLYKIG